MFARFKQCFGDPLPGTAATPTALSLDSEALRAFADSAGGGVFANGLVSVLSVREATRLHGWEHWLPPGARLFGSSAFGLLMATRGDDVWIADTQYGVVVESSLKIPAFLDRLTVPEVREERLRPALFEAWRGLGHELPATSVLCPKPVLALGGEWDAERLAICSLPVYLALTAQLFPLTGESAVDVRRLSDERHS